MKLSVRNLSYSYDGQRVLEKLNMDVKTGEFVSILGPSGCGKSTLLNILAGMLKPETGSVQVDGQEIHGVTPHFAYMPQSDLLFPWLTILDNVCLYGKVQKLGKDFRERAAANFEAFGLAGYENAYPRQLSGGMRQRAAFLRTAMCTADILLLDEPFGALDVITRADMQNWLQEKRAALGRTTVLVTHDIDEAIYLSDRILMMDGSPAGFQKEIVLPEENRDRDWLFSKNELRREIYNLLKEHRYD